MHHIHTRFGYTRLCRLLMLSLLGVACSLASVTARTEAADALTIDDVRLGLVDHYRVGHWTRVRVDLQSDAQQSDAVLTLTTPDGEGVPSNWRSTHSLPAGASSLELLVKLGRVDSYLHVQVHTGDGQLLAERQLTQAELPDAVLGSQWQVVTLGGDLNEAAVFAARREKTGQEVRHCRLQAASQAPQHWFGYGGVDVVVLPLDGGIAEQLDETQVAALDEWVQRGGRLLVSVGRSADQALTPDSPLHRLLPGKFARVKLQREVAGLATFAGNTQRALNSFVAEGDTVFRLPMAELTDVVGRVVIAEGLGKERSPMVVRSSRGFGHLMFVATDLCTGPVSQWDGRTPVLAKLFSILLGPSHSEEETHTVQLTQVGFDDLVGQLRSSLDQFATAPLVPFSWIAVLVSIYVLMIGPLDYLLLRYWNRRFGWTWATFPLMVIASCLLANYLSGYWKGQTLRVNQAEIIDVDAATGRVRGHAWCHVFSPNSRAYDLQISPASLGEQVTLQDRLLCWQGLPGEHFGGMNTRQLNHTQQPFDVLVEQTADQLNATLQGLPIDTYSSRSLLGQVWGQLSSAAPEPLKADFDNQLTGSVQNPLPITLRDCRLCYGRWVYPLSSLGPHGVGKVDRFSTLKTLDGMLTRTKVDQDDKDRSQPWNRKDLRASRILEMMMLHQTAGGSRYTSLLHRFHADLDVTAHLQQNTAVLIGKADQAATSVLGEAETARSTTYFRFFLPVSQK